MKKIIIAFLMILQVLLTGYTDDLKWGGLYQSPNILLSAAVGYESFAGSGILSVTPGAEYLFFKPVIGSTAPFDIGAVAHLRAGLGIGDISGLYLGASAGVTVHFGFNGLGTSIGMSPLDKTEIFCELGVCADFIKPDGDSLVGFFSKSGVRYLLTENILVEGAYTHWRGANGASIGACLMLGEALQVSAEKWDRPKTDMPGMDNMLAAPFLMQFRVFYLYSFFAGGFYFDDASYKPGDGTIWEIRSKDSGDVNSFTIQRTLVDKQADGSKWWKIIVTPEKGKDALLYEFLVNEDLLITKIVFKDPDSGEIMVLSDGKFEDSAASAKRLAEKDYSAWIKGKQTIDVKAGKFKTDYIKYEVADRADDIRYEWWINKNVPGTMVRFHWQDASGASVDGELIKVLKKQVSDLNAF